MYSPHGANGPNHLMVYAIVNNDPRVPSGCETSRIPSLPPSELENVQIELWIYPASSFVLQIKKNPAPTSGDQRVGLPVNRHAQYSDEIMLEIFRRGERERVIWASILRL